MTLSAMGSYFSLLVFFSFGLFSGLFFFLVFDIQKVSKNNFTIAFVCDFFATIFVGLTFLFAIFKFESGIVSVFLIVPFVVGFVFFAVFVRKMFVTGVIKVYNVLKPKKGGERK